MKKENLTTHPKPAKPLTAKQKNFIEAFRVGYTFPEIFTMLKINAGHFSSWRRWQPEFRKAIDELQKENLANRRAAKSIGFYLSPHGRNLKPSPMLQALINARACVDMRARV